MEAEELLNAVKEALEERDEALNAELAALKTEAVSREEFDALKAEIAELKEGINALVGGKKSIDEDGQLVVAKSDDRRNRDAWGRRVRSS